MTVFDTAWSVVKEGRVYPRADGWEEIDPRIPGTHTMGMLQVKNTLETQMPEYEFKLINNHPHRTGAAYKILRRLRKDIGKSMELREAKHTTRGTELKPLTETDHGEQARASKSPQHMKRHDGASSRGKKGDKRDKGMGGKKISNADDAIKRIDRKFSGSERGNSH